MVFNLISNNQLWRHERRKSSFKAGAIPSKAAGKKIAKNAAREGLKVAKEVSKEIGKDLINVDAGMNLVLQGIKVEESKLHSVADHVRRKTLAGATALKGPAKSKLNSLTHQQAAEKKSDRSVLDCKMEIQVVVSGCLARFGDDVNVVSILGDLLKLMLCKEDRKHLSIETLLDIATNMIRQLNIPGMVRFRLRIAELLCKE